MKRITLAMALAACICLTGCKGKANRQPKGNNEAAVEETVTEEPVLAEEPVTEEDLAKSQELPFTDLAKNFKVKGSPNIRSFVAALPVFDPEYEWDDEETVDIKNGFFHFSEEGSGGVGYYGAIWKRDDGKRLFIFSYRQSEWNEYEGHTRTFIRHNGSPWYFATADVIMTGENEDQISFCDYDTGFAAYVYNEETHTLEFLPQPPINGWKAKNAHRELILPQKGKDITVHEGDFENGVDYTLKWNGMTFDM